VDGTGSGSCPVAGFGISGVEPSNYIIRGLVQFVELFFTKCSHFYDNRMP
jgi:hypothetical protein